MKFIDELLALRNKKSSALPTLPENSQRTPSPTRPKPQAPPPQRTPAPSSGLFDDLDSDEDSCDECEGIRSNPISGHTPRRRPSIVAATPTPGSNFQSSRLESRGSGANTTVGAFRRRRVELVRKWLNYFNERIFKNQLPPDLAISWSPRLTRTAGTTMMKGVGRSGISLNRSCEVFLSTKVVDSEERLKKTLLHELCHVAQYLIENEHQPPHGPGFKKWANLASVLCPKIPVSVTHDYVIFKPHRYRCKICSSEFGRFSKLKNIDKYKCGGGGCSGPLEYLGRFDQNSQIAASPKAETPYHKFVKSNFHTFKAKYPRETSSALISRIGSEW